MESKFNKEEITEIKTNLQRIDTHIPNDLTHWVWNTYKRVTGSNENQPCSCGSAGKHWAKAVKEIKEFIKEYDN